MNPDKLQYANFQQRLSAKVIDFLILGFVSSWGFFLKGKTPYLDIFMTVATLAIALWFNVYLLKKYGGTPGKLLLKIRITLVDGSPISWKAAILRHSVDFTLAACLSIGLLQASLNMPISDGQSLPWYAYARAQQAAIPAWYTPVSVTLQIWVWSELVAMLMNKHNRALHDFLAGTAVISLNPEDLPFEDQPQKQLERLEPLKFSTRSK